MTDLDLSQLELDDVMPSARFREEHRRTIDAPIEQVWPHCLAVQAKEVRVLGPLMALRMLPSLLRGKGRGPGAGARPLLDEFETITRVNGTDQASSRKFAPYWAIIRGPSGLIRRSWLAAIDRRATG